MRRIVTGETLEGTSFIASDGEPPRQDNFKTIPGFTSTLVWATEPGEAVRRSGADSTIASVSFVPGPGATRLIAMTFPPDSVREVPGFDFSAFGAEFASAMPGLAELFSADGMHATPSLDYAVVTSGELTLETDDGRQTPVRTGDVVVQNGTRHAWRNRSDQPATILVALVGA